LPPGILDVPDRRSQLKKIVIAFISLLILGFAVSSFAVPAEIPTDTTATTVKGDSKITIGGELRVRGVVQQNTGDFNSNTSNSSKGAPVTPQKDQPRPKQ
jgi:hypothetical protein